LSLAQLEESDAEEEEEEQEEEQEVGQTKGRWLRGVKEGV
jgi:hypothetical protein